MNLNGTPKQYVIVDRKPILIYTLEQFEKCDRIGRVIIVAANEWVPQIEKWIEQYHITKFAGFAPAGETRQRSIMNGLDAAKKYDPEDTAIAAIHDAARPLVSPQLISDLVDGASEYGGCLPVLPLTDTVYQTADGKVIDKLLNRDTLFTGQTPEVFRLNEYHRINHSVSLNELDSYRGAAQLAHQYGMKVHLIPGEYTNFKLTIPSDLQKFRAICDEKK